MTSQDIKQTIIFLIWVILICGLSGFEKSMETIVSIGTMIGTISMAWVSYHELKVAHNPIVYVDSFVLKGNKEFEIRIRNVGNYLATDLRFYVTCSQYSFSEFKPNKRMKSLEIAKGSSVIISLTSQQVELIAKCIEARKEVVFTLTVEYRGCQGGKCVKYEYRPWGAWVYKNDMRNVFYKIKGTLSVDGFSNVNEVTYLFEEK